MNRLGNFVSASILSALSSAKLLDLASLPLHTSGSKIVDANDNPVRLACVNWYGAHMDRYVVDGLDKQNIDTISQDIADKGFNCVRLEFSLEQYFLDPVVKKHALKANPDLQGLTSMQIFDRTVKSLTDAGVAIILNNHISDAMWCCGDDDGNGLWHNANYTADQWVDTLKAFTERYGDNPLVIGNDLRNEIRYDSVNGLDATWGDGNIDTDWKLAAETAANAILAINPDQLIFVEGLSYANNMEPIKTMPIQLSVPNRLVYSFHYYSW